MRGRGRRVTFGAVSAKRHLAGEKISREITIDTDEEQLIEQS